MKKRLVASLVLALGVLGIGGSWTSAESYTKYSIQTGDTFWTIAQKFNLDYKSLIAANPDQNPSNLYPGLVVNLPILPSSTPTAPAQQYTVLSGETLWTIAQKLKVDLQQLIAANPSVSPTNVYEGLKLNIPSTTTPYIIQLGDTFWTLSQKHGIPYNEILATNPNVNPQNLYPGLTIQLPLKSAEAVKAPSYLADGLFPLKKGTYTPFPDNYGDGRDYDSNGSPTRKHEGVDVLAPKGTPIYSAYDGVVINHGWNTLGGWRLTVKTPDGKYAFYYAHLSGYAPNVTMGSKITKGQLLGYIGDTGYGSEGTTGHFVAHMHFGMYDIANGFTPLNPYQHLKYWESRLP